MAEVINVAVERGRNGELLCRHPSSGKITFFRPVEGVKEGDIVEVLITGENFKKTVFFGQILKNLSEEDRKKQRAECLEILPECKKALEEKKEELSIFFKDEEKRLNSLERAVLDGRISVAYNPLRHFVSTLNERVNKIKELKNFASRVIEAKKESPKEKPIPPKEISVEKPQRTIFGEIKDMPDGTRCQKVWHFYGKEKYSSIFIYKYGEYKEYIPESEDGMRKAWYAKKEGWYRVGEIDREPIPEEMAREWEKKFSEYMAEKERYEKEKAMYSEKIKEWESDIVNISHYFVHLHGDEQHRGIVVQDGFPFIWDIEEGGEWVLIPLTYIPKTVRG